MTSTDLSKVHESVLQCNLSYWQAIEKELLLELRLTYSKQSEIYDELSKRKEKQMTSKITKEDVMKASMQIGQLQEMFENAPNSKKIDGLTFTLKQRGNTSFDYDTDSGKTSQHVYAVGDFFIALNGVYYSYNGLTLQSWEFVQPKTVQKVEYVKV